MAAQLKLVYEAETPLHHTTTPPPLEQPSGCDGFSAVERRVFEAWRALHRFGKPVQPRLTRERAAAVAAALAMGFDEAAITLAVEGCKASRFCQHDNRTGHPLDELTWILSTAERIERLANEGAAARAAFEQAQAVRAVAPVPSGPSPEAKARLAAQRQFLAQRATQRGLG